MLLLFALAATIRADEVHAELGVTGSGVGVAILDSGVDGTHAGLSYPGKTLQNVKIVARSRRAPRDHPAREQHHGR